MSPAPPAPPDLSLFTLEAGASALRTLFRSQPKVGEHGAHPAAMRACDALRAGQDEAAAFATLAGTLDARGWECLFLLSRG
jgi:hypothetical protein